MGVMGGYRGLILVLLVSVITCVENQPYSPENKLGRIVGLVKPSGMITRVDLLQGRVIKITYADSSGYYQLDSLVAGSYNLQFSAQNFGRQLLTEVMVYPGRTTTIPDVYLKPYPEQISAITPANGTQNFSLTAPIQIEFSVLMDHVTVENNFYLVPQVQGRFEWKIISGKSQLTFYPEDQYLSNLSYVIILTTAARTSYGDSLAFEFISHFHTEGVKVTTTIPENEATAVAPQTGIYIYFNSRMDRSSVEQSFSISPLKIGTFKWFDARRFYFQPGTYLASLTQYTVNITTNARDIYNNSLIHELNLKFETEPLRVISNYPVHGSTAISRSTPITIAFNTLVNQQAVEQAFSLDPFAEGWTFQWSDLTRFHYSGTTQLQPNTIYSVTIDTTCSDAWGNELPEVFRFIFRTTD